jgi:hypothetical protein
MSPLVQNAPSARKHIINLSIFRMIRSAHCTAAATIDSVGEFSRTTKLLTDIRGFASLRFGTVVSYL